MEDGFMGVMEEYITVGTGEWLPTVHLYITAVTEGHITVPHQDLFITRVPDLPGIEFTAAEPG
jgi:hypothetical protein